MSWDNEREQRLRELWLTGMSAAEVAAELGPWCTRSAVLGKVHRLGIAERPKAPVATRNAVIGKGIAERSKPARSPMAAPVLTREAGWKQPPKPAPKPEPIYSPPEEVIVIPESRRVRLLELKIESCRWPIGCDDDGYVFCGADRYDPYSELDFYCAHHSRVAHVPTKGITARRASDETKAKMRAACLKRGTTAWRQG